MLAEAIEELGRRGRDAAGDPSVRRFHRRLHSQPDPLTVATGPTRVAIVAGETSGDQLGAALITALRARARHSRCAVCAGRPMLAAGCERLPTPASSRSWA